MSFGFSKINAEKFSIMRMRRLYGDVVVDRLQEKLFGKKIKRK